MYSLKDIVRINDILSEYHGVKCVVVKVGSGNPPKSYDVETLNTKTRIRVVQEQIRVVQEQIIGMVSIGFIAWCELL